MLYLVSNQFKIDSSLLLLMISIRKMMNYDETTTTPIIWNGSIYQSRIIRSVLILFRGPNRSLVISESVPIIERVEDILTTLNPPLSRDLSPSSSCSLSSSSGSLNPPSERASPAVAFDLFVDTFDDFGMGGKIHRDEDFFPRKNLHLTKKFYGIFF